MRAAIHRTRQALVALRRCLEPRPRVVDWSVLAFLAFSLVTGVWSLTVGRVGQWVVVWAHGVGGLVLAVLLGFKLRRVRHRLRGRWDRTTALSAATATVSLAALASGILWVVGGHLDVLVWNLLNVHVFVGLLVVPLALAHLWTRFRPLRRRDVEGRRDALRYAGLLVGGALVWRGQQLANALLDTAGAGRRFTGSREVEGSSFPVTSWVADDPDPVPPDQWTLTVTGLVGEPLALDYDSVVGSPATSERATLDCTSGWYTVQDWQGVRVGDLLGAAGVADRARFVRFVSVTGYRWSLPLAEARNALLATHVAGDPLSHGHGAPARLVAPGRRGFQWVKWVERVEVRAREDPAQWLVTLVSGFD